MDEDPMEDSKDNDYEDSQEFMLDEEEMADTFLNLDTIQELELSTDFSKHRATTLFLLLLSLTTAGADSDVVLDVYGKPLEVGSEYYMRRAVGLFGGIGRSHRYGTNSPCPLYVKEYKSEYITGDPVKFVPANETQKEIHLSSDVQIDSGKSATCRSDGFWRVILDAFTLTRVVIATGTPSVPPSSFRMEKAEFPPNAYKITYSPPTSSSLQQQDQEYLTVFGDYLSGLKLVGLTNNSTQGLLFAFYKNATDVVASM
ncbi:hypothetical protein Cgig2_020591 [Carnegiea gigantea]|uniref:Uncharacterized protein n=1 Tax=Carnegiea gigantea TaxID=171969 RepID=A0A9Q1Q9R3_9CARY|nr:hypothetical protein Cgig2_020591 [Carnegiea gigantea]